MRSSWSAQRRSSSKTMPRNTNQPRNTYQARSSTPNSKFLRRPNNQHNRNNRNNRNNISSTPQVKNRSNELQIQLRAMLETCKDQAVVIQK